MPPRARKAARASRESGLAPTAEWLNQHHLAREYRTQVVRVKRHGDILEMMQIPGARDHFPAEEVACEQVADRDLGLLVPSRSARPGTYKSPLAGTPILVLGDSFCRIYQAAEPQSLGELADPPPAAQATEKQSPAAGKESSETPAVRAQGTSGKGGMPTPPSRGHAAGEAGNMPSEGSAGHATPGSDASPESPGTAAAAKEPTAATAPRGTDLPMTRRMLPGSAGFIAHLALSLGSPVDYIVSDGGASTDVRQRLSTNPEILAGKKVVIWQFVERDIRLGSEGWKDVPLPARLDD